MTTKIKLMPRLTEKQIAHFWSKIQIAGEDECWNWLGCSIRGYGCITFQYITYRANRIAYFLSRNKDPNELVICHTCDNPSCCNPKHLWAGTMADDTQDMVAKGRSSKGSKHHNTQFTNTQVRRIRKQSARGETQMALAEQYDVAQSTIHCIVNRKTWAHI